MKCFTQLTILFTLILMIMVSCFSIQTKTTSTDSCINKNKIATEIEIAECPRDYKPVCGCNGKTYGNICVAKKLGVKRWKKGDCRYLQPCIDKSVKRIGCQADWNPVCGCDGKTYSNACKAGVAGVTRWIPGKCEKTLD